MNINNKIETSANILIIALAIILSIILAQKFFFNSSSGNTEILKAGEIVSLAGVDFSQSEKTILIALNPDCPFCTESTPFYRLLGESTFQNKNIRLIGLFSPEVENEKDYIEKLGVKFDELQKTSLKI